MARFLAAHRILLPRRTAPVTSRRVGLQGMRVGELLSESAHPDIFDGFELVVFMPELLLGCVSLRPTPHVLR